MQIILKGEPKSTSHIYKYHCRFGFPSGYISAEGKEIKHNYVEQAQKQWKGKTLESSIFVDIKLFFRRGGKHDIDNYGKLLLDSLTGIVWEDDNQIEQMMVTKLIDKDNPRIEIDILTL
jgi:crossover junction endodeoxyribonuclease RusA